ncbi:22015_t:CDS:1, partial [Racocetra persica]
AKIWWKNCCPEIKILNEKEVLSYFKNIQNKKKETKVIKYINSEAKECSIGSNIKMKGFKAEK